MRKWKLKLASKAALIRIAIFFGVVGIISSILGCVMLRMPGKSYAGALPPLTEAQAALRDALRRDIEHLAGKIGERNIREYRQLEEATVFLEDSLTSAGYAPARQDFTAVGLRCRNIEVEIKGTSRPDEIVVIGGHYDSAIGAPGANDNATGAAGVLALARAFVHEKPARTLRFVEFTNEEPFFQAEGMGSLEYARRCRARGENIVAMICLETIGYFSDAPGSQKYPPPLNYIYPSTGNFIAFIGDVGSRHLVRQTVEAFRRQAQFPSEGAAVPEILPGVGWSDHWAFWQNGYKALMVTDTAPYRYPYYHTTEDTPDKVDYDRLARVVNGLEGVVRELADGK